MMVDATVFSYEWIFKPEIDHYQAGLMVFTLKLQVYVIDFIKPCS